MIPENRKLITKKELESPSSSFCIYPNFLLLELPAVSEAEHEVLGCFEVAEAVAGVEI